MGAGPHLLRAGPSPRQGAVGRGGLSAPYFWMLYGNFAFAVMSVLIHLAGRTCDWRVIALARTALCLAITAILALAAGVPLVFWKPATLWMRSVSGSISLLCTFYALTRLPVSDVLTLSYTFPIWVVLLSWPALGERPGLRVWLSVASGVAGVCAIEQPHLAAGNFASLLALAASVFTAVAMIGLHRLRGIDPRAVVVHFSAVSMILCLGLLGLAPSVLTAPWTAGSQIVWLLLGVGGSATAGQIWLTRAFAAGPAAKVAVVGLSQIVFALALECGLLGRSIGNWTLFGIALILLPTGAVLVSRRNLGSHARPRDWPPSSRAKRPAQR